MQSIQELRKCMSDQAKGRANTRAAGAGLWAWYVRAVMWDGVVRGVDDFMARHETVRHELQKIAPLTKEEKNSLTAAKCIIKKAVENNIDVWKRNDAGEPVSDESGYPVPRGKSDLQDEETPMARIIRLIGAATAVTEKEGFEKPDSAATVEISAALAKLLRGCGMV